jgi:hypothetical protein
MITVHVMNTWKTITEHPKKSLKVAFFESKSIESKRGRREEKRRKNPFCNLEKLISFLALL